MDSVSRCPVVTVIGSGDPDHANPELAEAVGRLVAEMGFHLLTGGGLGVMRDACRGFVSVAGRRGVSIGIIPRSSDGEAPKEGYPNPWVEIPILTHLPGRLGPDGADSRNAINVLSAWKILALPGGEGTRAEIRLAKRYGKPLLAVMDVAQRQEDGWDLSAVRTFLSPALPHRADETSP